MKPSPVLFLALCLLAAPGRAAPAPTVLVTDIGSDIDDAWALALALRSPELDLKMVLTDPADTVYRARLAAKFLQAAGHTDVAVGIGDNTGPQGDNSQTQIDWVGGYQLGQYPGKVYADGVAALIDLVERSPVPVTIIAIGPAHSLALAVRRDPRLAGKCRLVGMFGSFDRGYPGGPALPEFNVKVDIAGFRTIMAAPWRDILLTPLDTCGLVTLAGDRYHAIWSATHDPLLRALIECYCVFVPRANWKSCDYFSVRSSTLFDTVAVYLAYSEDLVGVESIRFDVAADGLTYRSATGPFRARVALRWKNEDGFEAQLAGRLLAH